MPNNAVPLKQYGLRVIQGHRKWHHLINQIVVTNLLLVSHSNYDLMLYYSWEKARYGWVSQFIHTPPAVDDPVRKVPSEYYHNVWYTKPRMVRQWKRM